MPTWSDATGIERSGYGSVPPLARVRYRVRQFVRGVSAQVSDQDRAAAVALLPADAAAHFLRLPIDAQHHSLNVLFALRQRGFDDPDLAAAALLHDVGKLATEEAGIRTNVWLRGPLVLLDAVGSHWARQMAAADPALGWRYALYVHLEHPAIGAAWAAAAGCTELTCWLIAHHQDHDACDEPSQRAALLAALQWADSRN